MEIIPVIPTMYRPIRRMHNSNYEHPTTVSLRRLIEANENIRALGLLHRGSKDKAVMVGYRRVSHD
jgi:hypothetical protein